MTPHISNAFPSGLSYLVDKDWAFEIPVEAVLNEAFAKLKCSVGFFSGLNHVHPSFKEALHHITAKGRWRINAGESSTDAWLDISEGRDAYLAQRSGNFRQKQRRARRILAEQGQLKFIEASEAGWSWEEIEATLVDAFERSWQVESEDSPLFESRRKATLKACQLLFESNARFEVFYYSLDDLVIAFEFGLSDQDTYYPLVRGHDKTYAQQSPGNLLAEESIDFFIHVG